MEKCCFAMNPQQLLVANQTTGFLRDVLMKVKRFEWRESEKHWKRQELRQK
jgi:hypothetical protein